MTIIEVISQVKKVRDELAAGKVVAAYRATFPIQEFVCDTLEGIGIKEAATEEQKAEYAAVSKEITDFIKAKGVSEVEAQKFGDGALLKLLLELFLKYGPIFL